MLSSRAPDEVDIDINWMYSETQDFVEARHSISNVHPKEGNRAPHLSLSQLTCQEILGTLDVS